MRATASQREAGKAEDICFLVEKQLSHVLELECNLQETFERMKQELEAEKGYSTKALFKMLDKSGQGFIDSS